MLGGVLVLVRAVPSNLPADKVRGFAVKETAGRGAGRERALRVPRSTSCCTTKTRPEEDSRHELLTRTAELEGELGRHSRDALARGLTA